ncbi:hypothetical protein FH972_021881 [Carpinus fangiana]|uniref:Uncharacterized protein n=1 Tax=Carpinus fangiana TaxID=176857 RepID=A0A5N6KSS0_9ROSI|nr:hypothetical protein FH972_021881 [Carpinus fangiana]
MQGAVVHMARFDLVRQQTSIGCDGGECIWSAARGTRPKHQATSSHRNKARVQASSHKQREGNQTKSIGHTPSEPCALPRGAKCGCLAAFLRPHPPPSQAPCSDCYNLWPANLVDAFELYPNLVVRVDLRGLRSGPVVPSSAPGRPFAHLLSSTNACGTVGEYGLTIASPATSTSFVVYNFRWVSHGSAQGLRWTLPVCSFLVRPIRSAILVSLRSHVVLFECREEALPFALDYTHRPMLGSVFFSGACPLNVETSSASLLHMLCRIAQCACCSMPCTVSESVSTFPLANS